MHMWRTDHNVLIAQMTSHAFRIASLHSDNPRPMVTRMRTIRVEAEGLWAQRSVVQFSFNKVWKT